MLDCVACKEKKQINLHYFTHFCVILYDFKNCWVLLNRAPTSTQPISTSTQLHPLHPALSNTLNNIWNKILHVVEQFPQI